MKRTLAISIFLIMIFTFCFSTSAVQTGSVYEINGKTIIFSENSTFTQEEQQYIAEILADPESNDSMAYGLMCNIFGHKNTVETVVAITHRVNPTSPRCLQETYQVSTCSRCGNVETTLISSIYIICCP